MNLVGKGTLLKGLRCVTNQQNNQKKVQAVYSVEITALEVRSLFSSSAVSEVQPKPGEILRVKLFFCSVTNACTCDVPRNSGTCVCGYGCTRLCLGIDFAAVVVWF